MFDHNYREFVSNNFGKATLEQIEFLFQNSNVSQYVDFEYRFAVLVTSQITIVIHLLRFHNQNMAEISAFIRYNFIQQKVL